VKDVAKASARKQRGAGMCGSHLRSAIDLTSTNSPGQETDPGAQKAPMAAPSSSDRQKIISKSPRKGGDILRRSGFWFGHRISWKCRLRLGARGLGSPAGFSGSLPRRISQNTGRPGSFNLSILPARWAANNRQFRHSKDHSHARFLVDTRRHESSARGEGGDTIEGPGSKELRAQDVFRWWGSGRFQ